MGMLTLTGMLTRTDNSDMRTDDLRLDVVGLCADVGTGIGSARTIDSAIAPATEPNTVLFAEPPTGPFEARLAHVRNFSAQMNIHPSAERPFTAVALRAVFHDGSNATQRATDRELFRRAVHVAAAGPAGGDPVRLRTMLSAANALQLDDDIGSDDDVLASVVWVDSLYGDSVTAAERQPNASSESIRSQTTLTLGSRRLWRGGPECRVSRVRMTFDPDLNQSPEDSAVLARDAMATDNDVGARNYISSHNVSDLRRLDAVTSNHLLDLLFDGTTANQDELAIIRLMSALPTSTRRELQTNHSKNTSAFESEVDGSNWTTLRGILASRF